MSSGGRLNVWERILLEVIWGFCWVVGHLPHCVQFRVLAPIVRFVLYRLLRYRLSVVMENLKNSFPEKSLDERRQISSDFYTVLSEIVVSTLALTNSNAYNNLFPQRDGVGENADMLRDVYSKYGNRSWIALTAHFGLWEYLMFWSTYADQRMLAIYHPLESAVFDKLFKRLRSHHKVTPMAANESLRFTIRNGATFRGESYIMGLIADQNPPLRPNSYWYSFLGQDTIFFDGGEKIALRIGLPVVFVTQNRYAPGRYEARFHEIWDGKESVEPNEITRRYVAMLEEEIRCKPHLWLWSHKRWKAKRTNQK